MMDGFMKENVVVQTPMGHHGSSMAKHVKSLANKTHKKPLGLRFDDENNIPPSTAKKNMTVGVFNDEEKGAFKKSTVKKGRRVLLDISNKQANSSSLVSGKAPTPLETSSKKTSQTRRGTSTASVLFSQHNEQHIELKEKRVEDIELPAGGLPDDNGQQYHYDAIQQEIEAEWEAALPSVGKSTFFGPSTSDHSLLLEDELSHSFFEKQDDFSLLMPDHDFDPFDDIPLPDDEVPVGFTDVFLKENEELDWGDIRLKDISDVVTPIKSENASSPTTRREDLSPGFLDAFTTKLRLT